MRISLLGVGFIAFLFAAPTVRADDLVPLVPKMEPTAATEIIIQFHDALAKGLTDAGLKIIPAAAVRAKEGNRLDRAGCAQGTCLEGVHSRFKSTNIATLKVHSVGKNYDIEAYWFSGLNIKALTNNRCDICTLAEALKVATRTATELGKKIASMSPEASARFGKPIVAAPIMTTPAPEIISKSSQPVGQQGKATAKRLSSSASPRTSPLTKPMSADLQDQVPTTPSLTPAPEEGKSASHKVWPLWPGLVAGGIGILGLTAGIPLIAINGDGTHCSGPPLPDKTNCSELYKTGVAGWTLTAVGIGGLTAAAIFIPLHLTTKPKEQAKPNLTQLYISSTPSGGSFLNLAGQF